MKFSINIDFVYDSINYLDAIREIKEIGFENIEVCFMHDKNIDDLEMAQRETGIGVELMLSDLMGLTDASTKQKFIEMTKAKVQDAKRLNCKKIIIASGDFLEGITHEHQLGNIEAGVRELLPYFEENAITALIEPINNKVDHPEAGLWSSAESFDMVRCIGSSNVKILFDIYHMQIMEGDVTRRMLEHLDIISHIHCAGNPGRNEPYIGELNYLEIVRILSEEGFDGCIGIEYIPTVSPKEGLTRLREMFARFM